VRGELRGDDGPGWRLTDLERRFGTPVTLIRSLIRAGHLSPSSKQGRLLLSFQDLVVMRAVSALHAARIPTRSINRALRKIRETLPQGAPLAAGALGLVGGQIALKQGGAQWEPVSGQYALALESPPAPAPAPVRLKATRDAADALTRAAAHFEAAYELEAQDPESAIARYRSALREDPSHTDARINLGRLLHLRRDPAGAEAVYRGGDESDPILCFNLGVLLEDLARTSEAISAYQMALASDPTLSDAHFNLARLYELAGDDRAALRHLLAYRRANP